VSEEKLLLNVELRCNACDDVLIVHSVKTDDDGAYAYVEPCKKCAALANLEAE
jgi:hypothetical protein